jgi:hypothetical protein
MHRVPFIQMLVSFRKPSLRIQRILVTVLCLSLGIGMIATVPSGQAAITPEPPVILEASPNQGGLIPASGGLRLQNRSPYPVRVVLLSRSVKPSLTTPLPPQAPAHWDFAPWEGRLQGVLVVLSERTVRLNPGDIVVAFAQDGSRRYWGPFVAGETPEPKWNQSQEEWQLVLTE